MAQEEKPLNLIPKHKTEHLMVDKMEKSVAKKQNQENIPLVKKIEGNTPSNFKAGPTNKKDIAKNPTDIEKKDFREEFK